ncbi:MAG: hypothetical protein E7379_01575 [Clostridiales bacterium]|nr:hypothetical protein [Clostridiales bacterium]
MIKICFICTGGTCRSIMAERLMKKIIKERKIEDVKVSSRGLFANGDNIAENAKRALKKLKASSANRKSIQLAKIDKQTLYVVMTEPMKEKIQSQKVITMKNLIGRDISDPYGQSEQVYLQTAYEIIEGIEKLLQNIVLWREK